MPKKEKQPPEVQITEHERLSLSDAMMIIAFPGAGRAGSVAAYYLIESLGLRWIASVRSSMFPPVAVIKDGSPRPPIAMYSAPMVCGMDGTCDQLIVVTSEVVPHPLVMPPLAGTILSWARKKRIAEIVAIESVKIPAEKGESDIRAAATQHGMDLIERMGLQVLDDGILSGFAGLVLVEAELAGMRAVILLVGAHEGYPDARAAAQTVEAIAPLLPRLEIDPHPLFERAQEIEQEIRQKRMKILSRMSPDASYMFG